MVCRLFFCLRKNNRDYFADSALYYRPPPRYNVSIRGGLYMTVRERILALRLLEKQEKHPEYTGHIGVRVCIVKNDSKEMEEKHV